MKSPWTEGTDEEKQMEEERFEWQKGMCIEMIMIHYVTFRVKIWREKMKLEILLDI